MSGSSSRAARMASATRPGRVEWVSPPGERGGDSGHGDRDVAPLVEECPALHVHQVEAVPTPGQAPGIGQVCPLQATRRVQVVRSGQDSHRATVPVLVEERKKKQATAANGPVGGPAWPSGRGGRVPFTRDPTGRRRRRSRPVPCGQVLEGVPMEPHEEEEGWFTDPFGRHEARWLSFGKPTKLVRDGDVESYDDRLRKTPTGAPSVSSPKSRPTAGPISSGPGTAPLSDDLGSLEPAHERRRAGRRRPSRGEHLARAGSGGWPALEPGL